jgi:hypothetical protein
MVRLHAEIIINGCYKLLKYKILKSFKYVDINISFKYIDMSIIFKNIDMNIIFKYKQNTIFFV